MLEHLGANNLLGCGDHTDDGYISALIDHVSGLYPVDADRIYAFGHSNGGAMTRRSVRPDGQGRRSPHRRRPLCKNALGQGSASQRANTIADQVAGGWSCRGAATARSPIFDPSTHEGACESRSRASRRSGSRTSQYTRELDAPPVERRRVHDVGGYIKSPYAASDAPAGCSSSG